VVVVFKSMLAAAALLLVGFGAAEAVWAFDYNGPCRLNGRPAAPSARWPRTALAQDTAMHNDSLESPSKISIPNNFVEVGYGPPVNSSEASLRCPGQSKSTWVRSICDFAPPRPNLPANFRRHKLDALTPTVITFPPKSRHVPVVATPCSMTLMPRQTTPSSKFRIIRAVPIQTCQAGYVPGSAVKTGR
jgi:hypothetical protein